MFSKLSIFKGWFSWQSTLFCTQSLENGQYNAEDCLPFSSGRFSYADVFWFSYTFWWASQSGTQNVCFGAYFDGLMMCNFPHTVLCYSFCKLASSDGISCTVIFTENIDISVLAWTNVLVWNWKHLILILILIVTLTWAMSWHKCRRKNGEST